MFEVIFFIILAIIIITLIKSAANYKRNASSPILTQNVKVMTKRTEVTRNASMNNNNFNNTRTHYYVTFETEAGQRMELIVSGREYGMLVEGDRGKLTYQGEWFKKFERSEMLYK